jgi:hypothetical protein
MSNSILCFGARLSDADQPSLCRERAETGGYGRNVHYRSAQDRRHGRQVVECSADAEKPAKIDEAMELANQIAIHFGLKAAFNYAGAVGYGSGHAFDKANCTQSIDGWKAIQDKYLNK